MTYETIKEKLRILIEYYDELEEYSNITLEEYLDSKRDRRAIERILQLVVEVATDINNMILKSLGSTVATDYYNSFIDLSEEEIISAEFAIKIAPSTGLRNILVHEYEEIDDKVVYSSIDDALKYYKEYIKIIGLYLEER